MTWFAVSLAGAALYACLWILARASKGIPSSVATAVQFSSGPLLLLYAARRTDFPWHEPIWWIAIILSLCVTPFVLWLATYAVQRTQLSVVKPIAGVSSIVSLLIGAAFLGEHFPPLGIIGILASTMGFFFLYHGRWSVWETPYPWIILGSAVFFGFQATIGGLLLRTYPDVIAVSGMYFTCVFVTTSLLAAKDIHKVLWDRRTVFIFIAFIIAALGQEICTAYPFIIAPVPYVLAVKRTSIIMASLAGYFLFRERDVSLMRLTAAAILVTAGIIMLLI